MKAQRATRGPLSCPATASVFEQDCPKSMQKSHEQLRDRPGIQVWKCKTLVTIQKSRIVVCFAGDQQVLAIINIDTSILEGSNNHHYPCVVSLKNFFSLDNSFHLTIKSKAYTPGNPIQSIHTRQPQNGVKPGESCCEQTCLREA